MLQIKGKQKERKGKKKKKKTRTGIIQRSSEQGKLNFYQTLTSFCCHCFYFTILTSVAEIAQLGERQTEDLKVPGSNPESSYEL